MSAPRLEPVDDDLDLEPFDGPSLIEALRGECSFLRACHPRVDDESKVWVSLRDLEELLDMAEAVSGGSLPAEETET